MGKNIVFCADGTWNSPGQDDNKDGTPDNTNVYKLFLALQGEFSVKSLLDEGEQEKSLEENGVTRQVAKYIHGVGDSRNPIVKLMGGATGAGTVSRIIRGYTFISRHYQPGDNIVIVGFSRGAYTARALAGMIASQGLLKGITYKSEDDRKEAYKRAAQVWYRYRKSNKDENSLASLAEAVAYLPGFISKGEIKAKDLQPVPAITAVAVWDTVGAMGVPDIFGDGEKRDAFRFADTRLHDKVRKGLHAVSLDERRAAFLPTLWDVAANVEQVVFPGAHADVGGGYPETGLSDIALDWMLKKLVPLGVLLVPVACRPDPGGVAHKPWLSPPFNDKDKQQSRKFRKGSVVEDASIQARCNLAAVKADPSEKAKKYAPDNRP